jgi:mRNA-degrading endonuclease toxin of MazEF toxin-antitoxin module
LKQFEVWRFDFPDKGEHPVVIISPPDFAAARNVNILCCTSQRQSRRPYPFEVMLNSADGLDWETFCDCSAMYLVPSAKLYGRRGTVILERRIQIRRMIRDVFRLMALD